MATTSAEVLDHLVRALRLDLVGPGPDDAYADEVLREMPSRFYLTGFLVPVEAPTSQKADVDSNSARTSPGGVSRTDAYRAAGRR